MKKLIGILLVIIFGGAAYAQQTPMFTHYMYNTLSVNPAYAGSRQALTLCALTRHQWVGLEGAPATQTFTAHSPIFKNQLGMGASVVNDKIGPSNSISFYTDFSYRMQLSKKGWLSFGLKTGFNQVNTDYNALLLNEGVDPAFNTANDQLFLPNFGVGVYFKNDKFYAGLSSPMLLEHNLTNDGNDNSDYDKLIRHYFFIAGGVKKISTNTLFKPTVLVKGAANAPLEADLSANFLLYDQFWVGAMYRTRASVGALIGYQLNSEFVVGYSFDWATTALSSYNNGTHEIMLTYDLVYKSKSRIKSPRYF